MTKMLLCNIITEEFVVLDNLAAEKSRTGCNDWRTTTKKWDSA